MTTDCLSQNGPPDERNTYGAENLYSTDPRNSTIDFTLNASSPVNDPDAPQTYTLSGAELISQYPTSTYGDGTCDEAISGHTTRTDCNNNAAQHSDNSDGHWHDFNNSTYYTEITPASLASSLSLVDGASYNMSYTVYDNALNTRTHNRCTMFRWS